MEKFRTISIEYKHENNRHRLLVIFQNFDKKMCEFPCSPIKAMSCDLRFILEWVPQRQTKPTIPEFKVTTAKKSIYNMKFWKKGKITQEIDAKSGSTCITVYLHNMGKNVYCVI